MATLWVVLISAAIGVVLGSYGYTFIVQRDASKDRKGLRDHVDELDRAWSKTADDMRKARDVQVAELKADTQLALSNLTVSMYDFKLDASKTFATTKSVERVEANLIAVIGKVESTLERRLDKIEGLIKNGHA